jgi:hypothetical protein
MVVILRASYALNCNISIKFDVRRKMVKEIFE